MIWVLLAGLALLLWWVWDIRRALGLRLRPTLRNAPGETIPTDRGATRSFPGAIPPCRYVVVRWPDGHHFYGGCIGAMARRTYEHLHPKPGEEIEFWELGNRRGHKAG
jgi:hypothetical protein